jgi:hypothetical protein
MSFFHSLKEEYYNWSKGVKEKLLIEFLNFVEFEDKIYCHVPDHISYKNQAKIYQRLEWRRQALSRWAKKGQL